MKKVKPKGLVIDASVATQAGGHGAPKPGSKACRAFLEAVLRDSPHRVVMSREMTTEWHDHAASYARAWRVQMYSRRRVQTIDAPTIPGMESRAVSQLERQKDKEAVKKDLHLVYAAWAADKLVISMDETVRDLFRKVAPKVVELAQLGWVNPDRSDEKAIEWLAGGCHFEPVRLC